MTSEHISFSDAQPADAARSRERMTRRVVGAARATLGLAVLAALAPLGGCRPAAEQAQSAPKPPEVTVSQVVQRSVTDFEEFTGRLEAVQSVELRARVRGYLTAVHFQDGQEVTAGTLLFEIDPRPFEAELKAAEGQKAQWVARRDKAQADQTRYEGLVPTGAASAQDLDKARAELGEAIAGIKSADAAIERAKLDLEFARVVAPIDGQVGQALITKGNLVQSGTGPESLLTTLVSVDPMYVYFGVNERTALRFKQRRIADSAPGAVEPSLPDMKIPIRLGLANESGFPYAGVIDFADNRVDPSTGTIRVRAVLDNDRRVFKPGLFARVQLPVSKPYEALLVSQLAIGTDQGQKYVMTVNDKGVAERRFVRLGPTQQDGLQVVSEGLQPQDWIIVNGLQRARPGKPVTPQRAEMPTRGIAARQPASSQPQAQAASEAP